MAITFVAATEAGSSGATQSQAINVPAGVVDDDVLLLFAGTADGDTDSVTTPTGWNEIVDNLNTGGGAPSPPGMSVYWRVADSEPVSYNIDATDTVNTGLGGQMLAFRGVDTTTPIDVTSTTSTGDSTNADPPSIDYLDSGACIVVGAIWDSTTVVFTAVPTNYTSPSSLDDIVANGGGNGFSLSTAYDLTPAADPENPGAFTSDTEQWACATVALRTGVLAVYDQEGFRFRDDDGSESGASWLEDQDVNTEQPVTDIVRLRILIDVDDDPPTQAARLQYKRDDEATSEWRDV